MITRSLLLPKDYSLLVFGPRGSGKSTLIQALFPPASTHRIDLLDPGIELELSLNPQELRKIVAALPPSITHLPISKKK